MRVCLPLGLLVIRTTTSVSKSTCEDDESFEDSYGWTCRDYQRAPYQCNQSAKYAIDGETALASCCACHESSEEFIFLSGNSVTETSSKLTTMRRTSTECYSSCRTGTNSCAVLCGNEKSTCESKCNNVKEICDIQCEFISEDTDVADTGGFVPEDDGTTAGTSNSSTSMLLLYLGIGFVAVLCLCSCCFVIFCLMRNRVITADADSCPEYVEEETRMVSKPFAQDKRGWQSSDPYDPNHQISGAPCQGEPAYKDY